MRHSIFFFFLLTVSVCIFVTGYSPAFAARSSYFEMTESISDNISPFPKWTGMMRRFGKQQTVSDENCGKTKFHPCSIFDWKKFLESIQEKSLHDKLDAVNDWGNEHPYIEDMVNWGMEDYWETPYEFMEVNGDCEDYAISKYYSLRALGISSDRLRVIVLQDLNLGGIIHAVLGVYDDDDKLMILDNQSHQVRPALKIYHYRPIYGINEESWWAYYPRE